MLKKDLEPTEKLSDIIVKKTADPSEQKRVVEDFEMLHREVDEVIERTTAENERLQSSLKPWEEFHDTLPVIEDWIERATVISNKDLLTNDPIIVQELVHEHQVQCRMTSLKIHIMVFEFGLSHSGLQNHLRD